MKKISKYILAAILMLGVLGVFSSCQEDDAPIVSGGISGLSETSEFILSNYYKWDAVDPVNGTNPDFNTITLSNATNSCKNAPTADEMRIYLGNGVYWDNGDAGANQQSYTVDGTTYNKGLWVKKWEHCNKSVSAETVNSAPLFNTGRPDASEIDKYFFLPAAGYSIDNSLSKVDIFGYYWSSSPFTNNIYYAYGLFFNDVKADVYIKGHPRNLGFVPMKGFDPTYTYVKDITISPDTLNIKIGQTETLTATVTMSDSTHPTSGFTWKINSPTWVVTNAKGEVVVLGFDQNIITGSSKTNTISLKAGDYYGSTTIKVIYQGVSHTAVVNVSRDFSISNYYQWDAVDPVNGANPGYPTNSNGVATNSCKNAPTRNEMKIYLGNGVYWDNGAPGANQQSYIVDGTTYNAGLWVKKWKHCDKSLSATEVKSAPLFNTGRPDASEIDKYFFLPACGYYDSTFRKAGNNGYYWSCTAGSDYLGQSYNLSFDSYSAIVIYGTRGYGYVPMPEL